MGHGWTTALVAFALCAAACGSSSGTKADERSTVASAATGQATNRSSTPASNDGASYEALLATMPATGDPTDRVTLRLGDVRAYATRAGAAIPARTDRAAITQFRTATYASRAGWTICPLPTSSVCAKPADDVRAELGFAPEDFTSFAIIDRGPGSVLVASGAFDEAAMTSAMGAPATKFGGRYWAIGTESTDLTVNTPARPYGQGLRILLRSGALIVTTSDDELEATAGPTSAPDVQATARLLARRLDQEHATSAALGFGTLSLLDTLGVNKTSAEYKAYEQPATLPPYLGYATATLAPVGSAERGLLLVAFADASTATTAATALRQIIAGGQTLSATARQPWTVRFAEHTIEVADNVVVLRYKAADAKGWLDTFVRIDLPIVGPA